MALDPGNGVTGFGTKLTIDGAGWRRPASVTGLLKLAVEPTFTVNVAGVPAQTDAAGGVTARVKPGVIEQPGNLNLPMRVFQLNAAVVE